MLLYFLFLFLCSGVHCKESISERWAKVLRDTDTIERKLTPILNFTTKCFDGYGCYYNGPPFFNPVHRPVSLPPGDDPDKKIHFWLYTPQNVNNNYTLRLTPESLKNSPFNASAKTIIYIHGWQQHIFPNATMFLLKDAVIKTKGFNYFIVDWREYTGQSYEEASANGRVVGTAAANLIKFLSNHTSTTPAEFHVLGHSLGGQVVAYTGQETPGLGRITAMDASGPYFFTDDLEVRLDAGDALFVDVIHTNGGWNPFDGLGLGAPMGHQDFYPNGGQRQPGCGHEDPATESLIDKDPIELYLIFCCDHARSQDFFIETILNEECTYTGTECGSYEDWKKGKCRSPKHQVAVMGIDATPIPGAPEYSMFFLDTENKAPFCKKKGHIHPTHHNANL